MSSDSDSSLSFSRRHIGPGPEATMEMLRLLGYSSLDAFVNDVVPKTIRTNQPLTTGDPVGEYDLLIKLREIAQKNKRFRSFIGQGYYGVAPLSVITRNVLENPGWYTAYTPYQAEIAQGRLEALLNFQTMVIDLTGMQIANASLLDESTAAAEAMIMMFNARSRAAVKAGANKFFVDEDIFVQTLDVITTRSKPLGIQLIKGTWNEAHFDDTFFGAFVQYPAASGQVRDYREFVEKVHTAGALAAVAADLMSLTLLMPPGEWGADVVVGSSQRFGLPMSFGGPHAGFFATRDELKRSMPGRIIGVSVDAQGNLALRMALQTREQHIKRERATSNICTAQALLATMSGMFAQYHGPEGLKSIANHIHKAAATTGHLLEGLGLKPVFRQYFDTVRIALPSGISSEAIEK